MKTEMGKDKEKEELEVKQIIEGLTNFKNYGFVSKNGFLTAAIRSIQGSQDFQARKTAEILDQIANLIDVLEAERDVMTDYKLPANKTDLLVNLLKAASFLAKATIVKKDPANWIEQRRGNFISPTTRKKYKYQWAF